LLSSVEVKIKEGNYQSYTDSVNGLAKAIKDAMDVALISEYGAVPTTAVVVAWNQVTGKFTITIDTSLFPVGQIPRVDMIKLVAFTIPNYTSNAANIVGQIVKQSYSGAFQDSHQILGGCNEKRNLVPGATVAEQFANLTDVFKKTDGVPLEFEGYYAATLQSQEAIYMQTNLQTTDFETNAYGFPQLISSRILAAIPAGNTQFAYTMTSAKPNEGTGYQKPYEVVEYLDNGNNLFSCMLREKSVPVLELSIRDSYGRLIPAVSAGQTACNAMSFTCVLRIDVFDGSGP
jgi:hypothetical protein